MFKSKTFNLIKIQLKSLALTEQKYKSIQRLELNPKPILFFGDLEKAEIITLGINPSSLEFEQSRCWPEQVTRDYLDLRLVNYFNLKHPLPHRWFDRWEKSLNIIGKSYLSNAAHLDISPRPTFAMSSVHNYKLFLEMLQEDVFLLEKALAAATNAKCIISAQKIGLTFPVSFVEEYLPGMWKRFKVHTHAFDSISKLQIQIKKEIGNCSVCKSALNL